jgi:hypothetical protein
VRLGARHVRVVDSQGLCGFRIASLTLVNSDQVKHAPMACATKGKSKSNGHKISGKRRLGLLPKMSGWHHVHITSLSLQPEVNRNTGRMYFTSLL